MTTPSDKRHGRVPSPSHDGQDDVPVENRYLVFRLGGELYGAPLLDVREIIEHQACKPIPHVLPHFLGVINLRGQITGVIDLRIKLGIPAVENKAQVFMVFDTDDGLMAAVVDQVEAVVSLPAEYIDQDPHVVTKIPLAYLAGIARHGDHLVSLLNLKALLSEDEFVQINQLKLRVA